MIEPAANFRDSALVVLGHGTELNANSATPAKLQAAELRRRNLFHTVSEAFWKQEPQVETVLAGLKEKSVFIVPLFVSEGYFSGEVIPRSLGFAKRANGELERRQLRGRQTWSYSRPVGTHDKMGELLLARATEAMRRFPFPRAPLARETSLFIAGHGTERSESSRAAIDRQVERLREAEAFGEVHAVFLDEDPRIPQCYSLAKKKNLVVVPFLMSEGLHVQEDIPRLLGEPEARVRQRLAAGQPPWRNPTEKHGCLVWLAGSIGTAPSLADIIIERVTEVAVAPAGTGGTLG